MHPRIVAWVDLSALIRACVSLALLRLRELSGLSLTSLPERHYGALRLRHLSFGAEVASLKKMANLRKIIREPRSPNASGGFWRFVSKATLSVAVLGGILIMITAVSMGDHLAALAIRANERLIGNDLVASVDRVLYSASAQRRANIEALAGLPCNTFERKLAELETHLLYIREVSLVENGYVHCSSALGPVDVPLSAYLNPRGALNHRASATNAISAGHPGA
ncbi:diguanylate phosphodiesterase [Caballeronia arvi]|uniref:Diguanylate phosphodiesterase n=1 Tax=Caballeronia arvi TaxID=1777135 RepID=A0A158L3H7_9BURK|nr:CSS-motif domain-containing protein [Caballeronia arvi]SAL87579.1 diguanylate phosphodiesterase [Caballeronia arvi]